MKLVLFCFLLAASHSFIFCQDANKAEALFARIEALDATVQLLSNHIQRQDERIKIIQKRDERQQARIEELDDIVKLQQEFINDVISFGAKEKSRTDVADTENNENTGAQEPPDGDHGNNISTTSCLDKWFGHVQANGKSMTREIAEAVAFHVTIDAPVHFAYLNTGQVIVFDSVHLNTGGGYHSAAGIFIAPKSGTYLFSLSVGLESPSTCIILNLIQNGHLLARTNAYGHDQGSVTVATQLQTGDEVLAKGYACASDVGMLYGGKYTSFMGILITP